MAVLIGNSKLDELLKHLFECFNDFHHRREIIKKKTGGHKNNFVFSVLHNLT